jgi:ABC-2 type transport system ATP-binding protein
VRSPELGRLAELLAGPDVTVSLGGDSAAEITGLTTEQVGETAAQNRIVLHELTPQRASLEEAFMELTREDVEFHADASLLGSESAAEPEEVAP